MAEKVLSKYYTGIGLSDYIGEFSDMSNVDIYSKYGVLMAQFALAKESGAVVDEPCFQATDKSNNTYYFSSTSGKRWKRTSGGTYSLYGSTNANGAHTSAEYYDGYIYYTTNAKLGRMLVSTEGFTDSWQSLASGDHQMYKFDLILYIGNGENVALVDDTGAFTSSGLDLPEEYDVVALMSTGDDLLILGKSQTDCKVFRWNTIASSWTISDSIKEVDAFAFLDADNNIFIICASGNIYLYTGERAQLYYQMPAFTSFNHALTTNHIGKPLIANGNRIYSFHRKTSSFNYVLVGEYTATDPGNIQSINAVGERLLVSHDSGVDNISNYRADAYVDTVILFDKFTNIEVGYQDIPTNTSITVNVLIDDIDKANLVSKDVTKDESDMRVYRLQKNILNKRNVLFRINLNSNTTSTPVIDAITLL